MQLSVAQRRPGGYVGGGRPLGGRTLVIGGSQYPGAVSADGWRQRSTPPLEGLRGGLGMASAKWAPTNPNLLKGWGLSAPQVVLAPAAR